MKRNWRVSRPFLLTILLLLCLSMWPARTTIHAQAEEMVTQEIRYLASGAETVFFVWGVDGWQSPPPTWWPTGTEDKDGVLHTPMTPTPTGFTISLSLPTDTIIDYGFLTTKLADGSAVSIWEANGNDDYHTQLPTTSPLTIETQFNYTEGDTVLLPYIIRYRAANAGQVNLVWGINNWQQVPKAQQPPNTAIVANIMYSPMQRIGDTFTITLQLPANAILNYDFQIAETIDGDQINVWDSNDGQDYRVQAIPNGNQLHIASRVIAEQIKVNDIAVTLPTIIIISAALLLLFTGGLSLTNRITLSQTTLAIILIIATLLRFNHITQPLIDSFSWREASTAMMAENYYQNNANIFYPEVNWTGPGPNYQGREFQTVTYLASLAYRFIGQQDWIGRAIAASFGVWGVFALYHLIRRVWDEPRALLGAAIMAILPGTIFIDRSFLPDPAMVALVTTSFWFLVAYLQTERRSYLLGAAIVGAWGFATKLPGLIIGLPMLYVTWALLRQTPSQMGARLRQMSLFALLGLLPVFAYYWWARHLSLSYPPYHFAGAGNWVWDGGVAAWWQQRYFLADLFNHLYLWFWTAPVIALVLLGIVLPPKGKAPWLFHFWLLAFGLYYLIGAQELVDNPWNLHLLNPAAAALASHACLCLISKKRHIVWSPTTAVVPMILLILIFGLGQAALYWMYQPYADQDYVLGQALQSAATADELVVTLGSDLGDPIAIYYSQQRGWVFPPAGEAEWDVLPANDALVITMLDDLQKEGADWLGIVGTKKFLLWTERPSIGTYIDKNYELYTESDDYLIYRIP